MELYRHPGTMIVISLELIVGLMEGAGPTGLCYC